MAPYKCTYTWNDYLKQLERGIQTCAYSCSVSLDDLLSHPELDPDSDGSFTEEEAQVATAFHCVVKTLIKKLII